eukprot:CAMPEP_0174331922 /NCGR_PEP_ID=MMETSP0810-20121108/17875_1 /TAXON_ID=73025 ORGANISM="Eutreptiella gymnastica-like, Strain CCMP1594" /NCGR_SAMPLE_ID=MMETSP0810 /ASSEMBLY_ACC=CAM_ASM_000659 /LENGTH=295 /DNA_ID=CAMNT_0015448001 /DNA_START=24 /DNA_END=911 /DNA_ORIENTATION=+
MSKSPKAEYQRWDFLRCPATPEVRATAHQLQSEYVPRKKDEARLVLKDNLYGHQPKLSSETMPVRDPILRTWKQVNVPEVPDYSMPNLYPVPPEGEQPRPPNAATQSVRRYLGLAREYGMHHSYRGVYSQKISPGDYNNPTTFNPRTERPFEGAPVVTKSGFRSVDMNHIAKCAYGRSPRSNPMAFSPRPPGHAGDALAGKTDGLASAMSFTMPAPPRQTAEKQPPSHNPPAKREEDAAAATEELQMQINLFEDRLATFAARDGRQRVETPLTPDIDEETQAPEAVQYGDDEYDD